jgi:hypothetical protein
MNSYNAQISINLFMKIMNHNIGRDAKNVEQFSSSRHIEVVDDV